MVRAVNLLILFFNTWYKLRRLVSAPAMATVLAGGAALIIAGSVTADSMPQHNTPFPEKPSVGLQTSASQLTFREAPTVSLLMNKLARTKSPDSEHTRVAQPKAKLDQKDTLSTEQVAMGGTDGSAAYSGSSQPIGKDIQSSVRLAAAQLVCNQNSSVWNISSAQLTLQTPLSTEGMVIWHWETRTDSGTNSSGVPPISNVDSSQTVAAGVTTVLLTASDPAQPLLNAPARADYSYSFRMHITAPVDVVSDWVGVPQSSGSCQ